MTLRYHLVIKGGTLCTPGGPIVADLATKDAVVIDPARWAPTPTPPR